MTMSYISIILPTLNEEKAIGQLIDEIKLNVPQYQIVVIDGYSKDQTVSIALNKNVEVHKQKGKGKAGAIISALDICESQSQFLLFMDSDYSYDPSNIRDMIQYSDGMDEVLGIRNFNKISRLHRLGNIVLTKAFNLLHGSNVPDVCSGMYLLNIENLRNMDLDVHGFSIDQEILAQTVNSGKIAFVPINYRERIGTPKASTWKQGFTALFTIFRLSMKYYPMIFFSFLASLIAVPASIIFLYASYLYLTLHEYHTGLFLTSVILFFLAGQGMILGVIGAMFRGLERKINKLRLK